MLQRPLQRGNFFLRGRDARTIGAVQRTKQHFFLYFQFLYFLGQLSNATGKVMQFGYLIERRFLFLRKDICIIQDLVVLPSGEEIRMDMAVVFKTGLTTTMFSRDAWFSEFITISNTDDLDTVYPICRAKDSWRNDDEAEVAIHRTIKSLKTAASTQ